MVAERGGQQLRQAAVPGARHRLAGARTKSGSVLQLLDRGLGLLPVRGHPPVRQLAARSAAGSAPRRRVRPPPPAPGRCRRRTSASTRMPGRAPHSVRSRRPRRWRCRRSARPPRRSGPRRSGPEPDHAPTPAPSRSPAPGVGGVERGPLLHRVGRLPEAGGAHAPPACPAWPVGAHPSATRLPVLRYVVEDLLAEHEVAAVPKRHVAHCGDGPHQAVQVGRSGTDALAAAPPSSRTPASRRRSSRSSPAAGRR
ncbi:hypothetical protein SANTM175S_04105 [Streptomyces antimycoticus]